MVVLKLLEHSETALQLFLAELAVVLAHKGLNPLAELVVVLVHKGLHILLIYLSQKKIQMLLIMLLKNLNGMMKIISTNFHKKP